VWSAPCTRRRGAQVSWFDLKTMVNGFSQFGLKTGGYGFPGWGLKTSSYGLVIYSLKSLRWFLSLCLKTKCVMVCRLHHKIDGRMKTTLDMRQDLAACFAWKQVGQGFPSLGSRLVEVRRRWWMWHYRGGCVELNLNTGGSM
jgi:hypothetical protein